MRDGIGFLTDHRAVQEARTTALPGEADLDTHTITIDPRQHSRELLGTLIHECIHLLADDLGQPELRENKVSEWEEKISRVLWDAGFKRIA